MSRGIDRAAAICANARTQTTDKTDVSRPRHLDKQLLSVVSVPHAGASNELHGLVSVLAVPEVSTFGKLRPPVVDDWYRRGWVWSEVESQRFMVRHANFRNLAILDRPAEMLADRLVARDREGDDRHLCVECRHCRPGPRCTKHLAVLDILQRCDQFDTT
jgi:hypothetical protein